jgi:TatD DNase family protein
LGSCHRALELAERYPEVYVAIGVHPNDSAGFGPDTLEALRSLAQHPKVVAIGEIGLDYYWKQVPAEQQKRALRAQLELADEFGLPVILHSRDSNDDLLWELAQWVLTIRNSAARHDMLGVLHAFSGDRDVAASVYAMGFLISLGGPVTFRNARRLHALVPQLRPDRLMLETDAPYLAPHPRRGQRNEPGYLALIAWSLAALTGMSPEALAEQTSSTARRCFDIP